MYLNTFRTRLAYLVDYGNIYSCTLNKSFLDINANAFHLCFHVFLSHLLIDVFCAPDLLMILSIDLFFFLPPFVIAIMTSVDNYYSCDLIIS
jgi:hypothetical protein